MIPCCRIDSISSCSASRPKSFRGCNALGTMFAKSIWCTLSPASALSLGAGTTGVPISAPRTLPKPERAMRLRLPEQTPQRKQQCLTRRPDRNWGYSALRNLRYGDRKKPLKKYCHSNTKCSITAEGSKQTKDFCPVGFFVCWDPSHHKNQTNTTGKEKEHTFHVFIESS